jgi:conserved oligomeric Golgi complex subunit 6
MTTNDYFLAGRQHGLDVLSPTSPTSPQALRNNPLSSKVTTVLSASYADSDIRDALALLDSRGLDNNSETRRQLRLNVQKEVIDCNGDIIREFGRVAEVGCSQFNFVLILTGFYSNSNASA